MSDQDKFVAMVTAKAEVSLPLSEFQPRSMLVSETHDLQHALVPVIDYHNHLDALEPRDVLRVMDACGIEKIVNITMKTGESALCMIDKYHEAAPDRFATIGWMDWSGLEEADFVSVTLRRLEQLVERGARGIKFWKDLGLNVRDASGKLLRI